MLYDMATSSQRRDDVAKIAIDDMEQKTKEYLAESKPLKFSTIFICMLGDSKLRWHCILSVSLAGWNLKQVGPPLEANPELGMVRRRSLPQTLRISAIFSDWQTPKSSEVGRDLVQWAPCSSWQGKFFSEHHPLLLLSTREDFSEDFSACCDSVHIIQGEKYMCWPLNF